MPIEVRELVIKAAVSQEGSQAAPSQGKENNSITTDEEVIRLCVERVLEIIKEKKER